MMEKEFAEFLLKLRQQVYVLNDVQSVSDSYNLQVDVRYEVELNKVLKSLYSKVLDITFSNVEYERALARVLEELRVRLGLCRTGPEP